MVTNNTTDDVFPLTRDTPESESLGMMYVDDYELYNRMLNGEQMLVTPLKTSKDGPPYWLRIVPFEDAAKESDARISEV